MKRMLIMLCITAFLFNCTAESTIDEQETEETNFYALKVGNSWVYKNYKFNPSTQFYDETPVIDSVSIIGTQELNGNLYYRFKRVTTGNEDQIIFCNTNGEHYELLRDSLGFLIRDDGSIKYVNNNYDEHLMSSQSWGDQYFQLQPNEVQINLPSGNFESSDMLHFVRVEDGSILPGSNNYYYSAGIGRVFETNSFVSDATHVIEKRLDAYSIN